MQDDQKQPEKVIRHPDVITAEIKVVGADLGLVHYQAKIFEGKTNILLQKLDELHIERHQALQIEQEKAKQSQIFVPPSKPEESV
jgi:hypothetical protein